MAKVHLHGLMDQHSMWVIGLKIRNMDKAHILGLMGQHMWVIFLKIKNMVMAHLLGLMVRHMRVIGKMINKMVKA